MKLIERIESYLNEAVYKVNDNWMRSVESASISITSPLTKKTLTLYKNHFSYEYVEKKDEDILAKVIEKAMKGKESKDRAFSKDVDYTKEEMLVFMKYAAMFDNPRKVPDASKKHHDKYTSFKGVAGPAKKVESKDTPWGKKFKEGDYSQEVSSLGNYDKCPECGYDGVRKHLKAKYYGTGEDRELGSWDGKCPKCGVKLTILND